MLRDVVMPVLNGNVILKLLDKIGNSNINGWKNLLDNNTTWDQHQIEIYQENELKKLLNHAFNNSDYYKSLFSKYGIDMISSNPSVELKKLPVLYRNSVKENINEIKAKNYKVFKPVNRSTGGTTGEPLRYYSDKNSWSLGWALKLRDWEYGGYKLGEKMAILAGASLVPNQNINLKRIIWNQLTGFVPLSTTHYSDEIWKAYTKIILKKRIHYLRGYPSSILSFAEFIEKKNVSLNIKSIFTTAEVLFDEHRNYIESVFKCKIFDQYGAADAGAHASECNKHTGYHVSFEPSYCEVLNIQKDAFGRKTGELVYTNLTNYAMPMIRYSPGDMAELLDDYSCQCGRKTPMIKKVIGRTTERIIFSNGRVLAGPAFTVIFGKFNVKNYQLVQNTKDSIDVNIVKANNFSLSEEKEILKIMRFHAGDNISVNINYLNNIPSNNSGKNKFIISNI